MLSRHPPKSLGLFFPLPLSQPRCVEVSGGNVYIFLWISLCDFRRSMNKVMMTLIRLSMVWKRKKHSLTIFVVSFCRHHGAAGRRHGWGGDPPFLLSRPPLHRRKLSDVPRRGREERQARRRLRHARHERMEGVFTKILFLGCVGRGMQRGKNLV